MKEEEENLPAFLEFVFVITVYGSVSLRFTTNKYISYDTSPSAARGIVGYIFSGKTKERGRHP